MQKRFAVLGCLFSFFSVALGAFASHGLRNLLSSSDLEVFRTGVLYQFFHGLALLWLAVVPAEAKSIWLGRAGIFFVFGTVLFSGSLYFLVLTQIRIIGAITPLGGVCFLLGWGSAVWGVMQSAWNVSRE